MSEDEEINLECFKAMIGEMYFNRVVLASEDNIWDLSELIFGLQRQDPHYYWRHLKDRAISAPSIRDATTTLEALSLALSISKLPATTLALQTELCTERVPFSETNFGKELLRQLGKIERNLREEEEKINWMLATGRDQSTSLSHLKGSDFFGNRLDKFKYREANKEEKKAEWEMRKRGISRKLMIIREARESVIKKFEGLRRDVAVERGYPSPRIQASGLEQRIADMKLDRARRDNESDTNPFADEG